MTDTKDQATITQAAAVHPVDEKLILDVPVSKATSTAAYTATARLFLTDEGNVTREGAPDFGRRVSLLTGKGGQLSHADAVKYGLIGSDSPDAELVSVAEALDGMPEPADDETPAAYFARLTNDQIAAAVAQEQVVVPIGATRPQIEGLLLKHIEHAEADAAAQQEPATEITTEDTTVKTESESKAVPAAPENKAVTAPESTKAAAKPAAGATTTVVETPAAAQTGADGATEVTGAAGPVVGS